MPKSKNRKGQKQKSQQRTEQFNRKRAKEHREFMNMLQKAQADSKLEAENNATEDVVNIEEIGDIDDNLELNLDESPKKQ